MAFFKVCWDVVKSDIMDSVNNFHDESFLDKGSNATFLSLIPKSAHVMRISDFRPISLVGSVYKIMSKALACHLKVVLPDLISSHQSAFLRSRQAMDGVLVAKECMDAVSKNGKMGVLCKLDLEKAYDRVNWEFLDYMLGRMGFGKKWRKWMGRCYGTAHYSFLVNGTTVEHFQGSRGLRQGNPLSPFLFLVVADVFGALLSKAFNAGILEGFEVKPNGLRVSHLQFANDTLIMCRDSEIQIKYLRCVVRCFEAGSRIKVNSQKNKIYGVGQVDNLGRLADCLGCSVESLPSTYLGLPLGAPYKCTTSWNTVVDRIQKRLAGWKGSYLSKGGKLVLIKLVLSSLPTFSIALCNTGFDGEKNRAMSAGVSLG